MTEAPLRVLQIVQKPQRRGAEVFAHQLAGWMRDRGHEAHVLHLYAHDEPMAVHAGDVVCDADENSPLERVPGLQPRVLAALVRAIHALRPHIVQLNGGRSLKYGAVLGRLVPGLCLVYRNIDSPRHWLRGRVRLAAMRAALAPVAGVVAVSEQTLDEVRSMYRLRCPHRFIPNGVDLSRLMPRLLRAEARAQLSTDPSSTVLLFFGALKSQKRPDRFLRLVAACKAQGVPVVGWLLGEGPDRAQLQEQAAALGVGGDVRFVGARDDVATVIAAADAHVCCSDTEGIPAAVIEANALGVPTVGFRIGGLHECVVDGETGVLVAAGDEAALRDAVVGLVNDPARRRHTGDSARAFVTERFNLDRVAAAYVAFYRELSTGVGGSGNLNTMFAMKGRNQMHNETSDRRPAGDGSFHASRNERSRDPYVAPTLGVAVDVASSTLFSGTVDPDAGTIDFGD